MAQEVEYLPSKHRALVSNPKERKKELGVWFSGKSLPSIFKVFRALQK
jgi:hypothetical protein